MAWPPRIMREGYVAVLEISREPSHAKRKLGKSLTTFGKSGEPGILWSVLDRKPCGRIGPTSGQPPCTARMSGCLARVVALLPCGETRMIGEIATGNNVRMGK